MNGFNCLHIELLKAQREHDAPDEQLKAIVDAYWKFAFKNKEYYQLMFGLGMQCSGKGMMKEEFSSFQDMLYDCTYEIIKKADQIRTMPVICLMPCFQRYTD